MESQTLGSPSGARTLQIVTRNQDFEYGVNFGGTKVKGNAGIASQELSD